MASSHCISINGELYARNISPALKGNHEQNEMGSLTASKVQRTLALLIFRISSPPKAAVIDQLQDQC